MIIRNFSIERLERSFSFYTSMIDYYLVFIFDTLEIFLMAFLIFFVYVMYIVRIAVRFGKISVKVFFLHV